MNLRVCMVTQALYPDAVGGSPIAVHQLAERLVRRGVQVVVHTVGDPGAPHLDVAYEVVRHRSRHRPWDRLGTAGNPYAPTIREGVAATKADVIHLHSHLFFASVFGAKGAGSRPVALTVHGVRAVRGPVVNLLQEAWLRTYSRSLFRRAEATICLNADDACEVQHYGADPKRIRLLWNGYDETFFRPGPAKRRPVVAWVGRMVPEKGLGDLLASWHTVRAAVPDAELELVGGGPLRARLEGHVQKQGLAGVRFLGARTPPEVADVLRSSAVFAFPSLREGFPVALVEAMACGTPVVASASLAPIVGDGGKTVVSRDPKALAAALVELLQDPATARRLGEAARSRASTHYTLDGLADAHIRLYEELVGAA